MADKGTSGQWEHFAHIADIGVRGYGPTLEEAFAQAALALTAVVCDPGGVRLEQKVEIRCQAPNRELLLADWLNGVIYEMTTRKMLFGEYRVEFRGDSLFGYATGEDIDRKRHQPAVEPKGATLTELKAIQTPDGKWVAQCVIDV